MDRRWVLAALGATRAVIGTALVVAPERCARIWAGERAVGPGTRVFARVVGMRDVALGTLLLAALRSTDRTLASRLAGVGAATDAADTIGTLIAATDLDGPRRWLMPGIAAAAAIGGAIAASPDGDPAAPAQPGSRPLSVAEAAGVVDQQEATLEIMEERSGRS